MDFVSSKTTVVITVRGVDVMADMNSKSSLFICGISSNLHLRQSPGRYLLRRCVLTGLSSLMTELSANIKQLKLLIF